MKTVNLHIKGKVQGVYYRASMVAMAKQLEVTGWVKNESDGSVSALAHGTEQAIEALVQWCHQGPEYARVTEVVANDIRSENVVNLSDFTIHY